MPQEAGLSILRDMLPGESSGDQVTPRVRTASIATGGGREEDQHMGGG